MYKVWFTFRNELGNDVRDYLDNNGKGFSDDEVLDVSRELKARGHMDVRIVMIGNQADREEMRGIRRYEDYREIKTEIRQRVR